MTYQQTILNDKPAGFWMITAPSGTSETDLSGNAKTATITEATNLIDRGYRPLVTGTDTDRAYRFYNTNHKLTYPSLEAWEINRDHIPFSIELTYQSVDTTNEFILFAPQEASSAYVPDNGLYVKDNVLTFRVSNGSSLAPATYKTQATAFLNPGQTYHVVAVYDVAKIFLYVDGELADQVDVDKRHKFAHATANFVTTSTMVPTDTVKSEALFDAVSFFRSALSAGAVKRHYVMSTPNVLDTDLVTSLGGKITKINDEDATKAFGFSARERGWNHPLNKLTDLVVDDSGNLSLKKIAPAKLITGPTYYGNLLTWNQATVEIDTTGFESRDATPTIARSTAQAASGSASLLMTATAASNSAFGTSSGVSGIPAVEGRQYTSYCKARAAGTSRTVTVYLIWYNAAGTQIGTNSQSLGTVTSSAWVAGSITANAPAGTKYVCMGALVTAPIIGDAFYFDEIGVWEGAATNWTPPVTNRSQPDTDYSSERVNLLNYNQATAEEGLSNIGGTTNCNVTRVAAPVASGLWSFQMSSVAAGTMDASVSSSTFIPVTPGKTYSVSAKIRSATLTRTANVYIRWRTAAGVSISDSAGSGSSTSTSAWTTYSVTGVAPATAKFCDVRINIASTGGASELHYFDEIALFEGALSSWVTPQFNTDEINLTDSRMLLLEDIGEHLGQSQGGIGGLVDFTATYNDHVGEQAVAAVSSSDQRYAFEIVKKTDKNLYLRYKYRDTSGVAQVAETSWGAISSLLATQVYFYLEWGGGLATLYINSTSSPAVVAFDAGVPAPEFDRAAYAIIGGGADKKRTWNNFFKWIKLYNKQQRASDFVYNKTSVNGYTVKLANSLSVSQYGEAVVYTLTGLDSAVSVDQTRVEWEPRNSMVVAKTAVTDSGNLLTYNQALVFSSTASPSFTNRGTGSSIAWTYLQTADGIGSVLLTTAANSGQGVNAGNPGGSPNGLPQISEGRTYTAVAYVRSAAVSRNFIISLDWWNSANSYLSGSPASAVASTTSGWTLLTITATAPAGAAYAHLNVTISGTPGAGETHYLDKFGIFEGDTATWSEPYQSVSHGSEIIPSRFIPQLQPSYSTKISLSTDDSYYNVVNLKDVKLEAEAAATIFSENSWDQIITSPERRIYRPSITPVRQPVFGGLYVSNSKNNAYILPVDDRTNTSTPTGGSGASLAGPTEQIRTLELWLYPETQGYYVFYDGTTEYSMRYYDSGGFTTTGFTTLYVDGAAVSNGATSTTWYNRWHHIVLTNASAQITINTNSSSPQNLLTYNQASFENNSVTGWAFSRSTGAASNTVASHGTYSCAMTITDASSASYMQTGITTSTFPIPVVPGRTYTVAGKVRAAVGLPENRQCYSGHYLYDTNYNLVVTGNGSAVSALTGSWTDVSYTFTIPDNAAFLNPFFYVGANRAISDVIYWDALGVFEGSSGTWSLPDAKMWLGKGPYSTGVQATARYQNISYYPQNFTAGMALSNYKAYLGDVTAGSGTDNPGGRTVTEGAGTNPKFFSDNWETQVISVR